jgi:hypothetical protein
MPDPEFTLAPGTSSWMQAFAWDPLKDEIFMTQNIRTSNGRQTIKINKLGKADDQGVRRFISSMTLLRRAQHPGAEQHRDDRRQCYAIPDEHSDAVFGYESQQPGD